MCALCEPLACAAGATVESRVRSRTLARPTTYRALTSPCTVALSAYTYMLFFAPAVLPVQSARGHDDRPPTPVGLGGDSHADNSNTPLNSVLQFCLVAVIRSEPRHAGRAQALSEPVHQCWRSWGSAWCRCLHQRPPACAGASPLLAAQATCASGSTPRQRLQKELHMVSAMSFSRLKHMSSCRA